MQTSATEHHDLRSNFGKPSFHGDAQLKQRKLERAGADSVSTWGRYKLAALLGDEAGHTHRTPVEMLYAAPVRNRLPTGTATRRADELDPIGRALAAAAAEGLPTAHQARTMTTADIDRTMPRGAKMTSQVVDAFSSSLPFSMSVTDMQAAMDSAEYRGPRDPDAERFFNSTRELGLYTVSSDVHAANKGAKSALEGVPQHLQRVYDPARPRTRTATGLQLMALYKATHPQDDDDFKRASDTVAQVRQDTVSRAREQRIAAAAIIAQAGGGAQGEREGSAMAMNEKAVRATRRALSAAASHNPTAIRLFPNMANAQPLRRAGAGTYGNPAAGREEGELDISAPGTRGGDLLSKGNAGVTLNAAHPASEFVHVRMLHANTGGTLAKHAASYLAPAASAVESAAESRSGRPGARTVRVRPASVTGATRESPAPPISSAHGRPGSTGGRTGRLQAAAQAQEDAESERKQASTPVPRGSAQDMGLVQPGDHEVVALPGPVAYTAAVANVLGVPAPGVRTRVLDQVLQETWRNNRRAATAQGIRGERRPVRFSEVDPTVPPPFTARAVRGMRAGAASRMRVQTVQNVAAQIPLSLRIAVHGVDAGVEAPAAARAKAAARAGGAAARSVDQGAVATKAVAGAHNRLGAALSAGLSVAAGQVDAASGAGGDARAAGGRDSGRTFGAASERCFVARLPNVSGHTDLITHVAFSPREFSTGFAYDRVFTLSRDGVVCVWSVGARSADRTASSSGIMNRLAFRIGPHDATDMVYLVASQCLVVSTTAREVLFFDFNAQTGDAKLRCSLGAPHVAQNMPISLGTFVRWHKEELNTRTEYGFHFGYALGNMRLPTSQAAAERQAAQGSSDGGASVVADAAAAIRLGLGGEETDGAGQPPPRWKLPDGDEVLMVGDDCGGITVITLKRGVWRIGLRMGRLTDSVFAADVARQPASRTATADEANGDEKPGLEYVSEEQKKESMRRRLRSGMRWGLDATQAKVNASRAQSARHRSRSDAEDDGNSTMRSTSARGAQSDGIGDGDGGAEAQDGEGEPHDEGGLGAAEARSKHRVYKEHLDGVHIWRFIAHPNAGWVNKVHFVPDLAAVASCAVNGHVRVWPIAGLGKQPQTLAQFQKHLHLIQESSKTAERSRQQKGHTSLAASDSGTAGGSDIVPTVATIYPSKRTIGVAVPLSVEFLVRGGAKAGEVGPVPRSATNASNPRAADSNLRILSERPDKLVELLLQQHARMSSKGSMAAIRAGAGASDATSSQSNLFQGGSIVAKTDSGVRGAGIVNGDGQSSGGLTLLHGCAVSGISWSAACSAFALAAAGERWVAVYSPFNNHKLAFMPNHTGPVSDLRFLDLTRQLVVLTKECTMRVWSSRNFRSSVAFADPKLAAPTPVLASRWSPPLCVHPRTQALMTFTKVITVWPMRGGPTQTGGGAQGLTQMTETQGAAHVYGTAFNTTFHELMVLERSDSRRAVVWDVLTGAAASAIEDPHGNATATAGAFDADQRRLITGGATGDFLRVWNFHDGDLMREYELKLPNPAAYVAAAAAAQSAAKRSSSSSTAASKVVPWAETTHTSADVVRVLAVKRVNLSASSGAVGDVGVNSAGGGMSITKIIVAATSDGRLYIFQDAGSSHVGGGETADAAPAQEAAKGGGREGGHAKQGVSIVDPMMTSKGHSKQSQRSSAKEEDALNDLNASLSDAVGGGVLHIEDSAAAARSTRGQAHSSAALHRGGTDDSGHNAALLDAVSRHGAGLRLRIRSDTSTAVQRAKALATRSALMSRSRASQRHHAVLDAITDGDGTAEESKLRVQDAPVAVRGGASHRVLDEHMLQADGLPPPAQPLLMAPTAADFAEGRAHADALTDMVYVPPHFAATSSADGTVLLWSLATGRCVRCVFKGHPKRTAAMRAARERLQGDDAEINQRQAWAHAKQQTLLRRGLHASAVFPAAELESMVRRSTGYTGRAFLEGDVNVDSNLNSQLELTAASKDTTARLTNAQQRKQLDVASGLLGASAPGIEALVYLPKLAALAGGSDDGGLRVWLTSDPRHWQEYSALCRPKEGITKMISDSSGDFLVVGDSAGYVSVWDIVSSAPANAAWGGTAPGQSGSTSQLSTHSSLAASTASLIGEAPRGHGPCSIPGHLRILSHWHAHSSSAFVARDMFAGATAGSVSTDEKPRIAALSIVESPLLMDSFLATAAAASAVKLWTMGGQLVGVFGHSSMGQWDLQRPETYWYWQQAQSLAQAVQAKLETIVTRRAAKASAGDAEQDDDEMQPEASFASRAHSESGSAVSGRDAAASAPNARKGSTGGVDQDEELELLRQHNWLREILQGTSTLGELQEFSLNEAERRVLASKGTPAAASAEAALAQARSVPYTLPLDQDAYPKYVPASKRCAVFLAEGGPAGTRMHPTSDSQDSLTSGVSQALSLRSAASHSALVHGGPSAAVPLPLPGQVWVQIAVEGGIRARNSARERASRTGAVESDADSSLSTGSWSGALNLGRVVSLITVERVTKDAVIGWDGSPHSSWLPAFSSNPSSATGGASRLTVLGGESAGGAGQGRRRVMVPLRELVAPDVRDGFPWLMHPALSARVGRLFFPQSDDVAATVKRHLDAVGTAVDGHGMPRARSPTRAASRCSSRADSAMSDGNAAEGKDALSSSGPASSNVRRVRSLRKGGSGRWGGRGQSSSLRGHHNALTMTAEGRAALALQAAAKGFMAALHGLHPSMQQLVSAWGAQLPTFAHDREVAASEAPKGRPSAFNPCSATAGWEDATLAAVASPFKVMSVFVAVASTQAQVSSMGLADTTHSGDTKVAAPSIKHVLELRVRDLGMVERCLPPLPSPPPETVLPVHGGSAAFPVPSGVASGLQLGLVQECDVLVSRHAVPPASKTSSTVQSKPGWLLRPVGSLPARHAHAYDAFGGPSILRRSLALFRRDAACAHRTWGWCTAGGGVAAVRQLWEEYLSTCHTSSRMMTQVGPPSQAALFTVQQLRHSSSLTLSAPGAPRASGAAAHGAADPAARGAGVPKHPNGGKDGASALVHEAAKTSDTPAAPFSVASSMDFHARSATSMGDRHVDSASVRGRGAATSEGATSLGGSTARHVFGASKPASPVLNTQTGRRHAQRSSTGRSDAVSVASERQADVEAGATGLDEQAVSSLGQPPSLVGLLTAHSDNDYSDTGETPRQRALRRRARTRMGLAPEVQDATVARQVSAALSVLHQHNQRVQSEYESKVRTAHEQAATLSIQREEEAFQQLDSPSLAPAKSPSLSFGPSVLGDHSEVLSATGRKSPMPGDESTGNDPDTADRANNAAAALSLSSGAGDGKDSDAPDNRYGTLPARTSHRTRICPHLFAPPLFFAVRKLSLHAATTQRQLRLAGWGVPPRLLECLATTSTHELRRYSTHTPSCAAACK